MKKFLLGSLGTVIWVCPLIAIWMQTKGTKKICEHLERIAIALEKVTGEQDEPSDYRNYGSDTINSWLLNNIHLPYD